MSDFFNLLPTHQVFVQMDEIPLSLPFSRPDSLSFSASPHTVDAPVSLIIFVALYWTRSSKSRLSLCQEALNEMQHSRSSLTSTEYRCRITSLYLLATVFLLVAFLATRVHCWLVVTFLLPGSQGPSWKSCFPADRCLGHAGAQGFPRYFASPLLNFRTFLCPLLLR